MRTSITITTAICALAGLVGSQQIQQQPSNSTVFQVLNNTDGSSPSYQILQMLQGNPEFQSVIDILNDPNNNVTIFVPSDQVYYNITGQEPPSNNATAGNNGTTTNSTASATSTRGQRRPTSTPVVPSGVRTSFGLSDILSLISPQTVNAPGAAPTVQANYIKLPLFEDEHSEGAERFVVSEPNTGNLVMRALNGDLVRRQTVTEESSNNNASNYTTSPYYNEFNATDLAWYHVVNGSVPLNETTTIVLNTLLTNSTVDRFGSGSPLLVHPGNDSKIMVGTGLGYDATINQTIEAGNGMIYIIDKVLVPPVNTTQTLEVVQNATSFYQLLSQFNSTANALNDATNYTIFVPSNSALENFDASQYDNQTLATIFQAHVFPGVYYSTNLTSDANVTIQSSAGTNVTLSEDPNTGGVSVNGTNVVQANILMDNGVMHLIDGILNHTVQEPEQSPSETPSMTSSMTPSMTASNTATTSDGAFPTNIGSSSVITAPVSTLVSTGVMLSTTFFLYFIYA